MRVDRRCGRPSGGMAYGATKQEAESKVQAIALRVIADGLEREQKTMDHVQFAAA